MGEELDTLDARLAAIAARQYGVVTFSQLGEVGIGRNGVARRTARGRLHRLHRGVYAVGHLAPSWRMRWMAAVLACGEGAVLSHVSAAALWQLLRPAEGPTHVAVPSGAGRARRSGILVHRLVSLGASECTHRYGIRVTTPARTLADLRGAIPERLHRRAVREAEVAGWALGDGVESDRTRSELERAFLLLCRRFRLPPPEVNVRVGRWTVDFLWRAERVVVEVDGYRYHRGREAAHADRSRELELRRAGCAVLRFDERQVDGEAADVAADVAAALRAGRPGDTQPAH